MYNGSALGLPVAPTLRRHFVAAISRRHFVAAILHRHFVMATLHRQVLVPDRSGMAT
jgi:hypothetical protein